MPPAAVPQRVKPLAQAVWVQPARTHEAAEQRAARAHRQRGAGRRRGGERLHAEQLGWDLIGVRQQRQAFRERRRRVWRDDEAVDAQVVDRTAWAKEGVALGSRGHRHNGVARRPALRGEHGAASVGAASAPERLLPPSPPP